MFMNLRQWYIFFRFRLPWGKGKKMEDWGKKIENEVNAKIIVWGKIKEI